ncbi:MAG: tRNA 4-thiouridine(8) synthase ThiI [Patescibacteria group bacterium]|nr:tRNA 4-thiouridine(8) synthase ThiI [Patescibacteria group bacterium]MDD5490354.1 tRNA 4-thiouridine(8) synthase ThiI [Patescibacteria group bacterium]
MVKHILIHYSEIGLKGGNRDFFEKKLICNIQMALGDFDVRIKNIFGRLLLTGEWQDETEVSEKLSRVFGIAYFSFAYLVRSDLESIKKESLRLLKNRDFKTFAVRARRGTKNFPLKSLEIEREVGGYIFESLGDKKVNLKNPDITCHIEIVNDYVFIYFDKIKGPGGLPVGTAGKLVSLISGGFDSPVASWQMMRRGAEIIFVHFHSYPNTSKGSLEKVRELVKILSHYQFGAKLYLVPFLDIQKEIFANAPEKLRIVLYRRMMLRLAEAIAQKEKALGLVTGDNLGQVASQTLENMLAIGAAVSLPIYRPLVSWDKEEIINLAKKIGTHDISAEPFDDCCSLFAPRHPETRADLKEVGGAEKNLNIKEIVEKTIGEIEIRDIGY